MKLSTTKKAKLQAAIAILGNIAGLIDKNMPTITDPQRQFSSSKIKNIKGIAHSNFSAVNSTEKRFCQFILDLRQKIKDVRGKLKKELYATPELIVSNALPYDLFKELTELYLQIIALICDFGFLFDERFIKQLKKSKDKLDYTWSIMFDKFLVDYV